MQQPQPTHLSGLAGMRSLQAQQTSQLVATPTTNNPGCAIDELESSFRACITPFVTEEASVGVTFQDEQKPSVELAINEFIELARKTEAYFQKQRAIIATRHPELTLQEECEELEMELKRKEDIVQHHSKKLQIWQRTLKEMLSVSTESGLSKSSVK
uniref:Mediator of RNA polymerase II transcription subunit 28 n=1 Tax=Phallusia mammillata TaxID=59560 RepID=A0A6F9DKS5_9ASCI|nr:mediator of RNA polymerase II transcription subunit 28-like [Phallusia mammillata]